MDIFNVLLQPFIWAIDDILLSPNLEIDGIDVWTIILAFNITGFTIYGILKNLGPIQVGSSVKPETMEYDSPIGPNKQTNYYHDSASEQRFNQYVNDLKYW